MTRDAECILHPALSAILSIQPSVLDEIMTNTTMTGRGLIARFLYASPPSRIGGRTFRTPPVPPDVSAAYRSLIFHLMALPYTDEPQTLYLSEKAFDRMADYFLEHERFLAGEGQAIADLKAQLEAAKTELAEYRSVRGRLRTAELEQENANLRRKISQQEEVIEKNRLWSYFSRQPGTTFTMQRNE